MPVLLYIKGMADENFIAEGSAALQELAYLAAERADGVRQLEDGFPGVTSFECPGCIAPEYANHNDSCTKANG